MGVQAADWTTHPAEAIIGHTLHNKVATFVSLLLRPCKTTLIVMRCWRVSNVLDLAKPHLSITCSVPFIVLPGRMCMRPQQSRCLAVFLHFTTPNMSPFTISHMCKCLQYMVKRKGLDFTEYGLVDARAVKRQRLGGENVDAK